MSRELVSTEFDDRRISVIVHRSASDKLAVESFTRLACFKSRVLFRSKREKESGAPNENTVQNHLNIALLNVF